MRYLEYLMDILAKHGLINGKLLKAPKMMPSKFGKEFIFI